MLLIFEKIHMDLETISDRIQAYSHENGISSEISAQIGIEIPLWHQYGPWETFNIEEECYYNLLNAFQTHFQR